MSKLNPSVKPASKFDDSRLAGGSGVMAAKQSNVALLRRAVLANLLWEDVAYMDGKKVAEEIQRLIPLCPAVDVYNIALEARLMQKLRHTPLFIFSDSQDIDSHYNKSILPEPFGQYNYICDVSANIRGVNYRGRWTAEISGWSEHFLTYIAALEGLQNKFEEQ